MVLITNSWRAWAIGMFASLAIFAVIYFVAIQPNENAANQAVKTGLQQTQQAINQAKKQLSGASSQASGAAGQAGAVSSQAQQQLSTAAKLSSCVAAAGTDVGKIQTCQAKYGH